LNATGLNEVEVTVDDVIAAQSMPERRAAMR
jgi:hypothetical protein